MARKPKKRTVFISQAHLNELRPDLAPFEGRYDTEDWGKTWTRTGTVELPDFYFDTVAEVITRLTKECAPYGGTDKVNFEISTEGDYDASPYIVLHIVKQATPEEVAAIKEFEEALQRRDAVAQLTYRERLIADAKKAGIRPEELA